jgi:iron complex outermembrane receptor protein
MNDRRYRAPYWVGWSLVLGLPHAVIGTAAAAEAISFATPNEDIVVTAEFRERALQNTPLSITVVGAGLIEARGQTDLSAIANQAPNVVLKVLGGSYGPALAASIRGVGVFDFNPALEPGVGIYVDDVYYPTLTGADLALLDLERIEVLRGPQGTLIGRNAIGGAIKLVTRRPDGTNNSFLEATYGSAQRMGLRGSAGFGITNSLSGRIAGVVEKQDGYVDRIDYGCAFPSGGVPAARPAGECRTGLDGGVGYAALRGSLRFRPAAGRIDAVVSADFTHDERTPVGEVLTYASNGNPNVSPAPGIPFDSRFICGQYCNYAANAQPAAQFISGGPFNGYPLNATSGSDQTTFEGKGVSAHVNFGLTQNLSLQSITAFREYESTFNADDDLSPANVGFGQNRLNHHFASQEFRLNGQVGARVAYTLGAYASTQKTTYYTYQDIRYAPIPLQFVGNDPVNAETQAVFATAMWSATNALNVTLGARYTHESKDYTFSRLNLDGRLIRFSARSRGRWAFMRAITSTTGSASIIAGPRA